MNDIIQQINQAGLGKVNLLKQSKGKYLVSSMLAGLFVGLGIILIFTIGGLLTPAQVPSTKIIMGVSFGIALSLVIMAGSELFTGNNFVMTVSTLERKTSWLETLKIWLYSYVGNFVGSFLVAAIFVLTGLATGGVAEFINSVASVKMNAPFMELFMRGILCNILVCLAVWCSIKMKEETAKLIMIFWCLFAFITSGFEHSVANMTLLSISLLVPHPETVTLAGLAANLIPVSLGNMVGGILFVGVPYWYIGKAKRV
ncbi:formate/nitrite transporter family protein [Paenibacillus lutimineralis]|uniref:Formate/nitrite transporter family protein n=1 Tax=Paenibacillus lutimineralis TaxID=2707005 RepID=A0A3Q9IFD0_9BACL|nr:formate/nitrite transporter family protein [Paenibacillus lutimineralis]AZS17779.1 formate/nitrite transporter family protein [Paenibacillus lutimineralis]